MIFLIVYFIMGIATGDFGNFPLMIGMFLAMAIALVLPGIFLIGCVISFSMGTSMGTVTALAPIAIEIAPQGITPYAGQLLAIGGLASISPVTVAPFVFYSWLMFIFGIIFIIIGFPKMVVNKKEDK